MLGSCRFRESWLEWYCMGSRLGSKLKGRYREVIELWTWSVREVFLCVGIHIYTCVHILCINIHAHIYTYACMRICIYAYMCSIIYYGNINKDNITLSYFLLC